MAKFVALLTFGDAEKRLAARPRHRAYLEGLLAEGKLVASGPWADDTGAMIIYEAADEGEVRALLQADPFAEPGIVRDVQIKEWNRIFVAGG